MANEIGWGTPYDAESGYGMAAVNGAEIGYGTVVINSYSGETNISSQDADNEPTDGEKVTILDQEPLIYMDSVGGFIPTMYLSFRLADGVEASEITIDFYVDGSLSFNMPVSSGITQIWEFPPNGEYYGVLNVNVDGEVYTFTSNTLTV
jgi:hypothetical protein